MSKARITVVTSGHLSTCPRMLKAADALAGDGHEVRVVATCHEPWAAETDRAVKASRTWRLATVDYRRGYAGSVYWRTGVRYRAARALAEAIGPERTPLSVVTRAFGRVHSELVHAAIAEPSDLIYGGTTGALAAIAEAGVRLGVPYALDLEDLHHGEASGAGAGFENALAMRVERAVLPKAAFLTTSSEAIAQAYRERHGLQPSVIHNAFPLPARPPATNGQGERFRAYWFSQTIGPGRGLEDAVVALGRVRQATELVLRGRAQSGYLDTLRALASEQPGRPTILHEPPASPDEMVELARPYDVGLALEQATPRNRQLCLTNKAFTYILAGVPVVMTDTPGQRALAADLGCAAAVAAPGDVDGLAAALAMWAADSVRLDCAKRAAWDAASRRWHWEHPLEQGRLRELVRQAVS
jgi:glycosyltransferase involved in cell wall biosynthesis